MEVRVSKLSKPYLDDSSFKRISSEQCSCPMVSHCRPRWRRSRAIATSRWKPQRRFKSLLTQRRVRSPLPKSTMTPKWRHPNLNDASDETCASHDYVLAPKLQRRIRLRTCFARPGITWLRSRSGPISTNNRAGFQSLTLLLFLGHQVFLGASRLLCS